MVRPESAAQGAFSEKTQDSLYLGVIDGLIKQRRYEAALAFLDEYKQASPRAAILRGDALVGAGRPYDAVAVYKAATGSNYAAAAYNGMGRAQSALGIWAAAVENFRRASAVEPANAEYLNNLGYARLHLGARDSLAVASDNLRRAHQLNPDSATIRNNLILAARITNNHARMTALLDTIGDARERREVAEFTQKWTGKDNEQASHRDGGLP
jgi:Flp pilus assembly protein TadD